MLGPTWGVISRQLIDYFSPLRVVRSKLHNFHGITISNPHKRAVEPTQLKKKKIKRRRFSFDLNHSIARKIDGWTPSETRLFDQKEIQDAIADHSYRRIQIFYYQSLVYHNTNCDITRGKTELQHGTANHAWASAAHSSLLTNLHDNFFETLQLKLAVEGITERTAEILKALGVDPQKIENVRHYPGLFCTLLEGIDTVAGLIDPSSTLYQSMNATVELPDEVNQFDSLMEHHLRAKAIEILNCVSKENLHPYEATKKLVEEIESFFQQTAEETRKKIEKLKNIEALEHQIWALESKITSKVALKYLAKLRLLDAEYKGLKDLKKYSITRKLKSSLGWRVELLAMDVINKKALTKKVKQMSKIEKMLPNEMRDNYISLLEDSLDIMTIQWNNTRTPPFKSLSRKWIGNELHPCTEQDLFNEQLQILKRNGGR